MTHVAGVESAGGKYGKTAAMLIIGVIVLAAAYFGILYLMTLL
jgi:flagellar basal body-associated protein FliL